MNRLPRVPALAGLLLLLAASPALSAGWGDIGRFHRIDIREAHPKAYHPEIGDLIQCYLDFPVVPEQIVDNFQVTVEGTSVATVAVVNTSQPKIVGSGQVSLFLVPRRPGLSKVAILPVIPGRKTEPIEITFLVATGETQ